MIGGEWGVCWLPELLPAVTLYGQTSTSCSYNYTGTDGATMGLLGVIFHLRTREAFLQMISAGGSHFDPSYQTIISCISQSGDHQSTLTQGHL